MSSDHHSTHGWHLLQQGWNAMAPCWTHMCTLNACVHIGLACCTAARPVLAQCMSSHGRPDLRRLHFQAGAPGCCCSPSRPCVHPAKCTPHSTDAGADSLHHLDVSAYVGTTLTPGPRAPDAWHLGACWPPPGTFHNHALTSVHDAHCHQDPQDRQLGTATGAALCMVQTACCLPLNSAMPGPGNNHFRNLLTSWTTAIEYASCGCGPHTCSSCWH
jgi:hypothetical protein